MRAGGLTNWYEALLAAPGPDRMGSAESVLGAAAAVYGGALGARARLYRRGVLVSHRLSCPVVSVGNLTTGGTGKTPMVVYLARWLQKQGLLPAVVSRGYRGGAERCGGIVSDGGRILLTADEAGDEPWMMARLLSGTPVLVGRNRYRAGRLAQAAFSPDVVLLDDGFQHLRLFRDLDLVLLDASSPLGNGRIFPRGRLREPVSALCRADALVLTRCEGPDTPLPPELERIRAAAGKPILRAIHRASLRGIVPPGGKGAGAAGDAGAAALCGLKVAAFSGIARNEAFQSSVRDLGGRLAAAAGFDDHHRYRAGEIAALDRWGRRAGADVMATTDKDFARIGGGNPFGLALAVVGVDLLLVSGKKTLQDLFCRRIGAAGLCSDTGS